MDAARGSTFVRLPHGAITSPSLFMGCVNSVMQMSSQPIGGVRNGSSPVSEALQE